MTSPSLDGEYSAESLFTRDCLQCLGDKSNSSDPEEAKMARAALSLIACVSEFMACRMLTGKRGDDCATRDVKRIPKVVLDMIDRFNCGTLMAPGSTKYDLPVSGLVHAIIEDEDWDRRGSTP